MSATTDVLLDRLTDAEQARDAALAQLAETAELLSETRELLDAHRDDLVFMSDLRGQLDALGITPDGLTDRVQRLSGGPVGKLLGLGGNGDRATLVG